MALRTWISTLAILAVAAAPAVAQDNHRRQRENRGQSQQSQPAPQARERAVPRQDQGRRDNQVRPQNDSRRGTEARPQYNAQPQNNARPQVNAQPRYNAQPQNNARPQVNAQPRYNAQPQNNGRPQYNAQPRYNAQPQYNTRPQYDTRGYNGGRFNSRGFAPRIVRPSIILIAPYRPYVYRPRFSIGVYYGSDGYYPYGYTPRGYFDPIPGRYYGGVRITGAPRDARVFADGYYVGIVDDFDGIFQHMNLEAGPHHIEVEVPGVEPIAFDVNVRPGETVTFRADDAYFRQY